MLVHPLPNLLPSPVLQPWTPTTTLSSKWARLECPAACRFLCKICGKRTRPQATRRALLFLLVFHTPPRLPGLLTLRSVPCSPVTSLSRVRAGPFSQSGGPTHRRSGRPSQPSSEKQSGGAAVRSQQCSQRASLRPSSTKTSRPGSAHGCSSSGSAATRPAGPDPPGKRSGPGRHTRGCGLRPGSGRPHRRTARPHRPGGPSTARESAGSGGINQRSVRAPLVVGGCV